MVTQISVQEMTLTPSGQISGVRVAEDPDPGVGLNLTDAAGEVGCGTSADEPNLTDAAGEVGCGTSADEPSFTDAAGEVGCGQ